MKKITVLLGMCMVLALALNTALAAVNSPLNGGFETQAPVSPPFGVAPVGADWTPSARDTSTPLDNWVVNNTIPMDGAIYSTWNPPWRYGGPWSMYADSGSVLLGLNTKHDQAQFGGVQQDLGTMTAGNKLTLDATLYGHVHSDQNTVWDTFWDACDVALYQLAFYNVTDAVLLSSITEADFAVGFKANYNPLTGLNDGDPEVLAVTMDYTAQASDVGDTLRLLLLPRDAGEGIVSHVGIDDVTVTDSSVAAYLLGDANIDGLVSADDYASVQANFGNTGAAGGGLLGDANHDGLVSADDYASVQANFGNTSGGMSAVPEPATLGLLVIGLIAVLRRRIK